MQISNQFAQELQARRQRVFAEMPLSSIAVLPGKRSQWRNGDTEYPFRQDSQFYYLTGFCETEAVAVLRKDATGCEEYLLFCQASNPTETLWNGPRIGLKGARDILGANESFDIQKLNERMPELMKDYQHFVYTLGQDAGFDKKMLIWVKELRSKQRKGMATPKIWLDLKSIVDRLRLKKSTYEITCMQAAAQISAEAHLAVMKKCRPEMWEYQLEGEFLYHCYEKGVRALAYSSIVGGGGNACILHYIQNDQKLKAGDLVLIDAGCEYQYYAADITRTFPVSGRFTDPQCAIYDCVLKAQLAAIELIRPGVAWEAMQEVIVKVITEGLLTLGILKGNLKTLLEQKAYQSFYMHSSGHWLGLDVHDAGAYKVDGKSILLEAGMVLTVEPGIYIAADRKDVDKMWRGIGVRIEDDVLVTETGYEVLSKAVPKTVEDIEAVMASAFKS